MLLALVQLLVLSRRIQLVLHVILVEIHATLNLKNVLPLINESHVFIKLALFPTQLSADTQDKWDDQKISDKYHDILVGLIRSLEEH